MRAVLFSLLLFASVLSVAQVTVMPGTSITLSAGTRMSLSSVTEDTLNLPAGAALINNGVIILSDSTKVSEAPGFPITGSGYEKSIRSFSAPLLSEDINGLGIIISSGNPIDTISVTRGHTSKLLPDGSMSIDRWFTIVSNPLATAGTISFRYDSTELAGLNPDTLFITRLSDNSSDKTYNRDGHGKYFVTSSNIPLQGTLTLAPAGISNVFPSSTTACQQEALLVSFKLQGAYSATNAVITEISDSTGSFAQPVVLDSSLVTTSGSVEVMIPATLPAASGYRVRLRTTDPAFTSADNGVDITLKESPVVTISQLPSLMCTNSTSVQLNGSPAGGSYTGPGVDVTGIFNPASLPGGPSFAVYSYVAANGCSLSDTTKTDIVTPSVFSFTSITNYCISGNSVTLTAYPSGGTFSGPGIDSNIFTPSAAGTGTHEITYSASDSNGCAVTGSAMVDVYTAPSVAITNLDTLLCKSAASFTLYGSPAGGVFSGVAVQNGNELNPSLAGGNTIETVYTFTDSAGCTGSASVYTNLENTLATPAQPTGDTSICDTPSTMYTIPAVIGATSYTWAITPASAGTISSIDTTAVVSWSTSFSGDALLTAAAENSCGAEVSEELRITISICTGKEPEETGRLRIYPLPATDVLFIATPAGLKAPSISIVDHKGAEITLPHQIEGNLIQIPVVQLPAGIYLVRVTDQGIMSTGRFMK